MEVSRPLDIGLSPVTRLTLYLYAVSLTLIYLIGLDLQGLSFTGSVTYMVYVDYGIKSVAFLLLCKTAYFAHSFFSGTLTSIDDCSSFLRTSYNACYLLILKVTATFGLLVFLGDSIVESRAVYDTTLGVVYGIVLLGTSNWVNTLNLSHCPPITAVAEAKSPS